MNLLEYTKKLAERIKFYDSVAKRYNVNNPFAKPVSITIIWVDEQNK